MKNEKRKEAAKPIAALEPTIVWKDEQIIFHRTCIWRKGDYGRCADNLDAQRHVHGRTARADKLGVFIAIRYVKKVGGRSPEKIVSGKGRCGHT